MSDNSQGNKRPENKGSTVGPTFFLSLFLLISGVIAVAFVVHTLNRHEIPYQELVRLIENSKRDEDGKLADKKSNELIVERDRDGTIEKVRYSNLRDVRVGDRAIT